MTTGEEEATTERDLKEEFWHIVSKLEGNEKTWESTWKKYESARNQCILEGREGSWMACAIYTTVSMQRQVGQPFDYHFSLTQLLEAANLSALEFFDKMYKWKEVTHVPRRISEQVALLQSSLSVAAVVYKRLIHIFSQLFQRIDVSRDADTLTSLDLFKCIWTAFLILKKGYRNSEQQSSSDELITTFHLLLCIVEMFVKDISQENDELVSESMNDVDEKDVLEIMCLQFNGMLLEGKHLRKHWFENRAYSILSLKHPINICSNWRSYLETWGAEYEGTLKSRCELDERVLLPSSVDQLYARDAEVLAMGELSRRSDKSFDAHLAIRLSTHNCLNRLTEKRRETSTVLTVNTEQSAPMTPVTCDREKAKKLHNLLPTQLSLSGCDLEATLMDVPDSPLPFIKSYVTELTFKAHEGLAGVDWSEEDMDNITSIATQLFYHILHRIGVVERERGKDYHYIYMVRKEELLSSLYAICLEIVLHAHDYSDLLFPWCITTFQIAPIHFYKIIEIVVKAEESLARDSVRHLWKVEERILEELAWAVESPLWCMLSRRADGVPSSETIWNYDTERRALSQYSPVKRRKTDEGGAESMKAAHTAGTIFFRKVYLLAASRLADLCERTKMEEKCRHKVWTLFEHTLRTETSIYAGRHLDQNLLCILYVSCKMAKMEVTFHDIITNYRLQPQATARVYRQVNVSGGEWSDGVEEEASVDLIKYYNGVFISRVHDIVSRMETRQGALLSIPFPVLAAHVNSPSKKHVSARVSVSCIPSSPFSSPLHKMSKSPAKDVKPPIMKQPYKPMPQKSVPTMYHRY